MAVAEKCRPLYVDDSFACHLKNAGDLFLMDFASADIELIIQTDEIRYWIALKKDGEVVDRQPLATKELVVAWINAIVELVGQNFHVSLQPSGASQHSQFLELAMLLSRRGLVVGMNRHCCICRLPAGALN